MNPLLRKSIFRNVRIDLLSKEQISINLKIVLQEELHVYTFSRQTKSSLVKQPAHPAEDSLCMRARGWNAEKLPDKPGQGGVLESLVLPPAKGVLVLV